MQNRFGPRVVGLALAACSFFLAPRFAEALPDKLVEVSVVVDHALYAAKGADSEAFAQRLLATMDAVYFSNFGMHVRLVNVTVMDFADPWSVTMVGAEVDTPGLLSTFADWQKLNLPGQRDVTVLLSGYDFQSSTTGLGFVGTMCQSANSVSVVQAGTFAEDYAALIVEHEVGHNLGMSHDGNSNVCPPSGYIMAAAGCSNCGSVPTTFSSCSQAYFNTWLASHPSNCLYQYCGSGVVDAGEACDDGNITAGDCCDASCDFEASGSVCNGGAADACSASPICDGAGTCVFLPPPLCYDANPCTEDTCNPASGCEYVAAPATGCVTGTKAQLQISRNADDPAKRKLKWKLQGGSAVDQTSLGDPSSTRSWSLCVYDQTASSASLKSMLTVAAGAGWESKDPKGWSYEDKSAAQSGITKIQLKTGVDGKSSASLSAAGVNFPSPTPLDATTFFDADPSVIVQLRTEDSSQCWSTEFPTAQTNDGKSFKASVK